MAVFFFSGGKFAKFLSFWKYGLPWCALEHRVFNALKEVIMPITSQAGENEETREELPTIRVSRASGVIVLFVDEHSGTVLDSGDSKHPVGRFSTSWKPEKFEPYNQPVTLRNDEE